MSKWYAVLNDMNDDDREYGSDDLDEAKEMLAGLCADDGMIAVIEDGVCLQKLGYRDLYDTALVVVDRRRSDEWHDIVDSEEAADAMWDHLTRTEQKQREYFYLCRAYIYNGCMVSEIEEIKRYR